MAVEVMKLKQLYCGELVMLWLVSGATVVMSLSCYDAAVVKVL